MELNYMGLNSTITTLAGSTGPDELVPSRYAVQIGELEVVIISDGVLPLPTEMLGYNVDKALRAKWFSNMFLPAEALDWSLNVALVRSGERVILIDTGLGLDPDLNLPRAGQLVRRLGSAGIDLSSVTDIVLTHMHMDHIGGLLVEGVKERLRPDLKIHVSAAEVRFWASPDFTQVHMPPGFPDALQKTARRFMEEYRSYLCEFDERYEIAPGVIAEVTGGHTPGHCIVRIGSGKDRLTFAGDAVFTVGFDHPDWFNGFEHEPEEAARVRISLLRELAQSGEQLVATHLPFPSVGRVARDGERFRWVPAFWDY
ncbi:MBL fold metallo-hydrolase [Klebsiella aerogenes]|uniref:MBL fold metallo-hydrolase n=1 Tax=Klebsiella aerogenes TaxID=548 RepID=UPI002D806C87|nr:MBL fold metallo-hydrolase [Klebsiella aerogenes]